MSLASLGESEGPWDGMVAGFNQKWMSGSLCGEFDGMFPQAPQTPGTRLAVGGEVQHALAMFARAAKLDTTKLQATLTWLGRKELLNCKTLHWILGK